MIQRFPRTTLRGEVRLTGRGLHSGTPVRLTIAPGDQGIGFRYGEDRWQARPGNVTDTTRCTRLGQVSTIEHLMSAFAGLEITDAEVELDAPELPGMDGSAREFVSALAAAGRQPLDELEVPTLFRRLFLHEDGGPSSAVAKGSGRWRYVFDTGDRWPGEQVIEVHDAVADYSAEIASARTFAFAEEVEPLRKAGLGQGLDETSALILGRDGYENSARYPDEPVRHKLLDLMGDLYLSGIPVRAINVVAQRTGHRANVELAKLLHRAVWGDT